jgi:hypothetical protein
MLISLPYSRLRVTHGSRYHNVNAHQTATIIEARNLGADYAYAVSLKVNINGKVHVWTVRHQNRLLTDPWFNAHKGDPTKKVTFQPIRKV